MELDLTVERQGEHSGSKNTVNKSIMSDITAETRTRRPCAHQGKTLYNAQSLHHISIKIYN